ncbi:HNH endonuclease [Sphingomonas sp. HF-S3]|uniref:HNH endonuclease n=1 Tax=Sphingomonas rustica TaxID=3103142 RepID=A0ABV0B3B2_9SPHN
MVNLFVGITDRSWFDLLSQEQPEEVNFWQPSGSRNFRAISVGELFLFKLHSPDDYIVGGGVFSHASNVPLSLAWEAFGIKNGVPSLVEMRRRIARYRRDDGLLDPRVDPLIGCRILTQPFFWPREHWLTVPQSFARNIVTGKRYSADQAEGRYLWDAVVARSTLLAPPSFQEPAGRYGAPQMVRPRLGQGAFRLAVTDAYERRCAVSGEKTLPILDAAHIRGYGEGGAHDPANGLLLRTDIHRLFDLGYVTVSDDHRFEVSHRLKADFDNGRHYYDLHGTSVRPPRPGYAPPALDALAWHRENRYLG